MNGKQAKLLRKAFGAEVRYANVSEEVSWHLAHEINYWRDEDRGYHERAYRPGFRGTIRPNDGKRAPIVRTDEARLYRRMKRVIKPRFLVYGQRVSEPGRYTQLIRPSQARALDEG